MISSPWRPGIALATQVLEFCKVLDPKVKVLAKLGLGCARVGFGQLLTKVLQVLAKWFTIF